MPRIRRRAVMLVLSLVPLLASLLAGVASGGRNAGGALVLHSSDMSFAFRHNYCSEFPLPPTCEDLDTQVDLAPNYPDVVWVVAAFPANSSPGVSAYQYGIYGDITIDYVDSYACCPPSALEIPDSDWPAPGTGTAVAFSPPIYDHLFKAYWFAVEAPGPGATLATGAYPHGAYKAQFADDSTPPQLDDILDFGSVRWGVPGENHCPDSPPPSGACCYGDGSCAISDLADCTASGGTYQGTGTVCDPNPCPPPAACCMPDHTCRIELETDCVAAGGTFLSGVTCDPFPCPEACCFPDAQCQDLTETECASAGGTAQGPGSTCQSIPCQLVTGACCHGDVCRIATRRDCEQAGDRFVGDGTTCDPNPCIPTPTRHTTWGDIKAKYR